MIEKNIGNEGRAAQGIGGERAPDAMMILLALWDITHFSVEEDDEYLGREELEEFLRKAKRVVNCAHANMWREADAAAARMFDEYRIAAALIEEVESERDGGSVAEQERQQWQPRFTVERAIWKARVFFKEGFL